MPVKDCVPKSKLGNCPCIAFGKFQTLICTPELPADEVEFDGQAMHVELAEAPTAVEYVPAPQSVQTADPVNALYLPATHAVHGPPSAPENPALQVQFVKFVLPAGEAEFGGQSLHKTDPADSLYLPVGQVVHVVGYPFTENAIPAMTPWSSPTILNVCCPTVRAICVLVGVEKPSTVITKFPST